MRLIILAIIVMILILASIQKSVNKPEIEDEKIKAGFCLIKNVSLKKLNGNWLANIALELPTPCHTLSSSLKIEKGEIKIFFTMIPPKDPCIQVIKQTNQTVNLGKLKGYYTLNIFVNENKVWSEGVNLTKT